MSTDLSARHQSVQEAARWLTPNPRLPEGVPATVAAMFADVRDELLEVLGDGTQLVIALHRLTDAKDSAVRQAIADSER
jgi:hypothetical protein